MSPHAVSVVILQVLDLIHHIDVVEALISEGVTSLDDWTWVKQLRYYRTGRPGSTALVVKMADATMEYSWEYQGNAPKLVYTPLTDRCYLTLTQVTDLFLVACWSVSATAVLPQTLHILQCACINCPGSGVCWTLAAKVKMLLLQSTGHMLFSITKSSHLQHTQNRLHV